MEKIAQVGLGSAEMYHYLNQSGCFTVNGVNDAEDFENLQVCSVSCKFL